MLGGSVLRIVLVILAVLLAAAVLLGIDLGSLGDLKALALGMIFLAVALCVP